MKKDGEKMILELGWSIKEVDTDTDTEDIISMVEDFITEESHIVLHIEIDKHQEENWKEIIRDKGHLIKHVSVVVQKPAILVREVLVSTGEYLERATPLIEPLAEGFYGTPEKDHWDNLIQLFEGLGWILQATETIDIRQRSVETIPQSQWIEYMTQVYTIKELLDDFKEALENQDAVLIGDMLSYEILPTFQNIQMILRALLLLLPSEVEKDEMH